MNEINMGGIEANNETGVSSCEISSSTKGILTFKIKIYDKDIDKATNDVVVKSELLRKYCADNSTTPK